MSADPRIDAYIAAAADFARPILAHLRALVGSALPEADETIKWGMPHFTVDAKNVAGMAAFKAHCSFVIHGEGRRGDAMGQFGRIASLADLPPDEELAGRLRQARERVRATGRATAHRPARAPKPAIPLPDDLAAALAGDAAARATYDGFAPSHRREYLEWIVEAKTAPTRARRIAQTVEWLAAGRKRNWKYESC